MTKFRILIADDHPAIRRTLRFLLESHPDWEVTGEATNGREAVEQSARLHPDLIITDLNMPELNGLETIRQIRARDPDSSIIVLTMYGAAEMAAQLRDAGASDVVVKSEAPENLVRAVHDVQRRRGWLAGSILARPRHAVLFYRTKAEEEQQLGPFIREGLARRERIVHLVDTQRLHIDESSSIDVVPFETAIIGSGGFAHDAVLGKFAELLHDSTSRGFPLTRVIGETAWMMDHNPGFLDLEPRFNALYADYDDLLVCAYDVTRFSGEALFAGLCAHPFLLIEGAFHANPFFTS